MINHFEICNSFKRINMCIIDRISIRYNVDFFNVDATFSNTHHMNL